MLLGTSFSTAFPGVVGAEGAAILPAQGVAGFGTYEAGAAAALLTSGITMKNGLQAALALHGGIGIVLGALGSLILAYLLCLKLFFAEDIGTRPMLFTGFFLLIAGVQMVTSGVLAEMLARVYHEANGASAYVARPRTNPSENSGRWVVSPCSTVVVT